MFETKRVYEPPAPEDGARVLVDRFWPRGLTREAAHLTDWRKDLAPSEELRSWYSHEPAKFPRFRERYRAELFRHREALAELVVRGVRGRVTLVYASKDATQCNAGVLRELLQELSAGPSSPARLPSEGKRSRRKSAVRAGRHRSTARP